jgi:hypothetical protein
MRGQTLKAGPGFLFAALIVLAAGCSSMGGLDPANAMGMGGAQAAGAPPNGESPGQQVSGGNNGANGANGANAGGPTAGPNGIALLANPGATLSPNQARYPISGIAAAMNCPTLTLQGQLYSCTLAFNVPVTPSPASSDDGGAATASPSPSPDTSASPTPTPPGNVTLQAEALPADVPGMNAPDLRALKIASVMGVRVQGDTDFHVDGNAVATFTLPASQAAGRQFALQLYDETFPRAIKGTKRTDTFLIGSTQYTTSKNGTAIAFTFALPKTTVKSGDIWLIVLYALTYPPNNSPSPAPSASVSPSTSPSSAAASNAPQGR